MGTLGNIAIILSIVIAVLTGICYLASWKSPKSNTRKYAQYGVDALFILLTLAEIFLLCAILGHDYSIQYVYSYTSNSTSLIYLISALWAGNAGSLLFWAWFASLLCFMLIRSKREDTQSLIAQAMPIMMLVSVLFIALVLIENPFTPAQQAYTDGHGLNPMLEHFAMILHPPCLLAGYVMLAVPFALAVSALIQKRTDGSWVNASRSWALMAWVLLGAGNILGMWWAYAELGWGGYWAWDPIENSGLMPWLLTTAFLHSTMIERRRSGFKIWNILLIIFAFNLTIFGAFLSRSDILNSVHSYGKTAMSPVFVIFLVIAVGLSLFLLIRNLKLYKTKSYEDSVLSVETSFLLVNIVLVAATVAIWIGTMYPFFTELITGTRVEQTKDFFQTIAVPLFVFTAVLAGVCVVLGWKKRDTKSIKKPLLIPAGMAVVATVIMIIIGGSKWYVIVAGLGIFYMIFATIWKWALDVKAGTQNGKVDFIQAFITLFKTNRARYGAYIAHIGMAVMALGMMISTVYPVSTMATMKPEQTVMIKDYTITYNSFDVYMDQLPKSGSGMGNRIHYGANFDVTKGTKFVGRIHSEVMYYRTQGQYVSEIGIKSSFGDDIYISLDNWDDDKTVYVTVKVNPMVIWIWIGGVILILGGLISFSAPVKKELAEQK